MRSEGKIAWESHGGLRIGVIASTVEEEDSRHREEDLGKHDMREDIFDVKDKGHSTTTEASQALDGPIQEASSCTIVPPSKPGSGHCKFVYMKIPIHPETRL